MHKGATYRRAKLCRRRPNFLFVPEKFMRRDSIASA
jgi:hypothetical protein